MTHATLPTVAARTNWPHISERSGQHDNVTFEVTFQPKRPLACRRATCPDIRCQHRPALAAPVFETSAYNGFADRLRIGRSRAVHPVWRFPARLGLSRPV